MVSGISSRLSAALDRTGIGATTDAGIGAAITIDSIIGAAAAGGREEGQADVCATYHPRTRAALRVSSPTTVSHTLNKRRLERTRVT